MIIKFKTMREAEMWFDKMMSLHMSHERFPKNLFQHVSVSREDWIKNERHRALDLFKTKMFYGKFDFMFCRCSVSHGTNGEIIIEPKII